MGLTPGPWRDACPGHEFRPGARDKVRGEPGAEARRGLDFEADELGEDHRNEPDPPQESEVLAEDGVRDVEQHVDRRRLRCTAVEGGSEHCLEACRGHHGA